MNEFDDILAELKQKRDELRLQMHLASREIAEEWDELEEKMENFTANAKLDETGEGVGKALGQLGNELKLGYERIWKAIKED
jgi:vacuolar-type H+-ATPase subunit D/Vma8